LRLTSIGTWAAGTRINLERSLKIGDELGGHMVSGHVDGQAEIIAITDEGEARRFTLRAPERVVPLHRAQGVGGA
jgi:riboflavin synthase